MCSGCRGRHGEAGGELAKSNWSDLEVATENREAGNY